MFIGRVSELQTALEVVGIKSYWETSSSLLVDVSLLGFRVTVFKGTEYYRVECIDPPDSDKWEEVGSVEELIFYFKGFPESKTSVADKLLRDQLKQESSYTTDQMADLDQLIRELEIRGYKVESSGAQISVRLYGSQRGFSIAWSPDTGEFSCAYIDMGTQEVYDRQTFSDIETLINWCEKTITD